jgi:GTP cyclohydrolase II
MSLPAQDQHQPTSRLQDVGAVVLPTPYGEFEARAFEVPTGHVYLALCRGDLSGDEPVLTRLHSECLTGDALGSLRCDCGVQLRTSLGAVAAAGRGVVLYLTGHEGRGIGLVNKLQAYIEQDLGADTVDANIRLGLPVDARDYSHAGEVLTLLGVRAVRLLSNNPAKAQALHAAGLDVTEIVPLPTAAQERNRAYLSAKAARLGHLRPAGSALPTPPPGTPVDVGSLIGTARPRPDRPYVMVKYAQTLDGRIATRTGDSKWISGEAERRVSHALRAACDAVLVGSQTVACDDPQLTVRLVPGASPIRVLLDSTLRTPANAKIFDGAARTVVYCRHPANRLRTSVLEDAGVAVREVAGTSQGLDLRKVFADLRTDGVRSLMIEGGGKVVTSLMRERLLDRLVVSISPTVVGAGVEAVGDLGLNCIADGLQLVNRQVALADGDVLLAWDVQAGV